MTSEVAFNARTVELTDQKVVEQARNREQSESGVVQLRQQQLENSKRKMDAIREKNMDPAKWHTSELHTMVARFERLGDSNIPERKE